MAARAIAAVLLVLSLTGCAGLPAVLAVAGKALPIIQAAAAVAVDAYCSELVGAGGREAVRDRLYGDPAQTLIRREGC